jgi:hypothetical protein
MCVNIAANVFIRLARFFFKGRALCCVAFAATVFACAAQPASEPKPQSRSTDRVIYVAAQDLPSECYHKLGVVTVEEPFADASIDPDNSDAAKQLSTLALNKYPNDVDAVINIRSMQNSVGTSVTVTGDAIELEDHPTVECALRKMPGAIDTAAAMSAGAMAGTAIAGSLGGNVSDAEAGALIGGGVEGKYLLTKKQQEERFQQAQIVNGLQQQRRDIKRLLAERSRLGECEEQELSLADCNLDKTVAAVADSANNGVEPNDWKASEFQLKKQIQEQQDYINQLRQQVVDIRQRLKANH